jgi:hypothetical protein
MATMREEPGRARRRRPVVSLALGLVVVLLVVAAFAGLVALTLATDDQRTQRAPWAQRGAPDVKPQPIDQQ